MMKIFITYFLLSGLLTVVFTKRHWKEVLMRYPQLEIFSQEFILVLQFLLGFLIFPYWFSSYVYFIAKSGFFKLNLGKRYAEGIMLGQEISDPLDDEQWQELRMKRLKELKEKYFAFITVHDMELEKEIHHLLYVTPTIDNLETVLLGIVESRDTVMDGWKDTKPLYLITRENSETGICYYLVIGAEKLDLMDGWKITAIIKNPSDESKE